MIKRHLITLANLLDKKNFSILADKIDQLIKSAIKYSICPKCKDPSSYQGFQGYECTTAACPNYSESWKKEIDKDKPPSTSVLDQLSEDDKQTLKGAHPDNVFLVWKYKNTLVLQLWPDWFNSDFFDIFKYIYSQEHFKKGITAQQKPFLINKSGQIIVSSDIILEFVNKFPKFPLPDQIDDFLLEKGITKK